MYSYQSEAGVCQVVGPSIWEEEHESKKEGEPNWLITTRSRLKNQADCSIQS